MAHEYAAAGIEPPLEELLDDQIARLVMRRDGIEPAEAWRWVHEARSRLAGRAARRPQRSEAAATLSPELPPEVGD